jgi:hypothetical protein
MRILLLQLQLLWGSGKMLMWCSAVSQEALARRPSKRPAKKTVAKKTPTKMPTKQKPNGIASR